ncbi:hypothetical protein Misp01_62150 [Microtetraspora sp. NBRC 13810]|uniref:SAM-dependent methyltransferase n=1 Tax=Microtetraspora sp. NBRC 13810 TaxID=3030990 RepID=UPI0024A1A996|nr:SAM-dependent methyltransferase [Microtetraspora sp. NBRC 13810]GLW11087.1 hypothetical protein Misp01_62150 [Microtetraspora sp. NBRC 13810]
MTESAPTGIDPTIPSVARMYDYYLGGKDNFASDRAAAEEFMKVVPTIREIARENRRFLIRAVRTLTDLGIRQFVDIGTGLPTQRNVHEVAHETAPDAKIVYMDNDPIVLIHARALLADNPETIVVDADLRQPKALMEHPELRAHIDFDRPVALLMFAIVHFVPDDAEAADIVARLREPLRPGSYLAMSHGYAGSMTREQIHAGQAAYRMTASGTLIPRDVEQFTGYFDGLRLLSPGIVPAPAWRPDIVFGDEPDFSRPGLLAAVGEVV